MELTTLFNNLGNCMQVDRHRFRQRLSRLKKQKTQQQQEPLYKKLELEIQASIERVESRKNTKPVIKFPEDLPINARRDEIVHGINNNQVVIICGETGSGKSTQLPKLCLDMGRGVSGMIGHTQPRRIAARTVANRIADELNVQTGQQVGYKIRFNDHVGEGTYIKLMTDGILLAETQGDRFLDAYDTIIIDEAHERSLNIDFLLGYLKSLLPKRPDLKLIITSATIDPEKFSRHFNNAPIIEVSGRTYPVDLHYRPLIDPVDPDSEKDLQQGILDAVDELSHIDQGDILVFLPGEREIRETTESLRKHHPPNTEVIPLYAKLAAAEQNKVFLPHKKRHIVLATNVAETSLTVPGIRFVIDPGEARINRYSPRSKVQRLPIEKISQASANQRKGRCGRVSEGVCIRLYSEEDYNSRAVFTDPEIKRTSLASVILQLASLRFGEIESFPFVDPPDGRFINDGYKLLEELGAVDTRRNLTKLGRKLARLPVDPRIGRMILAGHDQNCLREILIIASALSVQDVRDKPMDKLQQADEAHARFAHEDSDFLWFLKLWEFYQEQKKHLSQNKMRKLCRTNFINFLRMREWMDIHSQLRGLISDMQLSANSEPANYENIHTALLSGLLGNIACLSDRREYTGARNIKLNIFPGSGQFKKTPKWIVAAELAETSKLYARITGKVEPEWIIRAAKDLLKRSYSDAYWSKKAGKVLALEKVTLYGLTLSADRKINYATIDPAETRRLFIQGALVSFEVKSALPFLNHNQTILNEVEALEHRSRRLDILIDEQEQFDFYNQKIPADIHNLRGLETWYKKTSKDAPELLFFDQEFLIREQAGKVSDEAFPESLQVAGMALPLSYHFEPGTKNDGVTVNVPAAILNQLDVNLFDWIVPGLIKEKVTALIRSLPKQLRRNFVPAPDYADAVLNSVGYRQGSLLDVMSEQLNKMTGVTVKRSDWDSNRLAGHLIINFNVVDHNGKTISEGRDLDHLQGNLTDQVEETFSSQNLWPIEREGITIWDFGDLPEFVESCASGMLLRGYPALIDNENSVSIRVLDTHKKAAEEHVIGLQRIIRLSLPEQIKYLQKNIPGFHTMSLQFASVAKADVLKSDLVHAIIKKVFLSDRSDIRKQQEFDELVEAGRSELIPAANELCNLISEILTLFQRLKKRLDANTPLAWLHSIKRIQEQLHALIYRGFISDTPREWLQHYPRYLKAIDLRLDKLDQDPARDKSRDSQQIAYWEKYKSLNEHLPGTQDFRWMIEEFRVSLFAQELGTVRPVSAKKLEQAWKAIK